MPRIQVFCSYRMIRSLFPFCVLITCLPFGSAKIPDLELLEAETRHFLPIRQEAAQHSKVTPKDLNTTSLKVDSFEFPETQKKGGATTGLGLIDLSNEAPITIATSKRAPKETHTTGKTQHDPINKAFIQAEGWGARIRSLAIILAVVAVPPAFAITLLFYLASKRTGA